MTLRILVGDGLLPIFEGLSSFFEGVGTFFEGVTKMLVVVVLIGLLAFVGLTLIFFFILNLIFFRLSFFEKYRERISRKRKRFYRFIIFIISGFLASLLISLSFLI